MGQAITIVAKIEAKSDCIELVKTELRKLVKPTRSEPGCLQYDLHQDNENQAVFLFFENWENAGLWQSHMQSEHVSQYISITEGAVANFSVNQMIQID